MTIHAFMLTGLGAAALALTACSPAEVDSKPETTEPQEGSPQASIPAEMVIDNPQPGAEVTSPIQLGGSVPGTWYFEGSFPLEIVTAEGEVITEHYASSQGEWMTEKPVKFESEIEFSVSQPTQATLVLREDDPSGLQDTREARVPLVLTPTP
ncbi:Gmad2 immunoglobulin-like domain-containing protein [Henriciella sp.]|uniref:Gmad2 immunoglobulin-like domain-containing protein n=1 Tax=Henriciella sp. TaxID=1968823 RepID=UPI00260A0D26|nr:Gmad2 immunoglobulin-like domain-containing protein [Henriciella sp.]